jgi:hypothetical protein
MMKVCVGVRETATSRGDGHKSHVTDRLIDVRHASMYCGDGTDMSLGCKLQNMIARLMF